MNMVLGSMKYSFNLIWAQGIKIQKCFHTAFSKLCHHVRIFHLPLYLVISGTLEK